MKNVKTTIFSAALLLLLFTSCQEEEILDSGVLFQSEETNITAVESEKNIIIRVESLVDTTDNRGGEVNATDYCNISFDINNNNTIDSEIDFGYESPTINYDICSFYFLENDAITHCAGHPTSAVFSEFFASSIISSTPHMIWELTIPKEELNQNKNLWFTVKTIDKGIFRTFPSFSKGSNPVVFSFEKTLTFKW